MTGHAKQLTIRANSGKMDVAGSASFPANTVLAFVCALEKLGYRTDSLLSKSAIRRSDLKNPDVRISCQAIGQLTRAALEQRPMKNLATHLATVTPLGAFPLLDYLVATSDSIGTALLQLARYVRLVGNPYLLDICKDGDPVQVRYENPISPFSIEYGIALALLHLRSETNGQMAATTVSFSHSPDDVVEIEHIFGCPVRAKQSWNGFELSQETWHHPMRRRDSVLRGVLEQHADEFASRLPEAESVILEVRRELRSRLGKGDLQIQSVARALATSTRSLQRRLTSAGVTYQEVLDSTRRDMAGRYLSIEKLSISEIAYLLGYSETATFHRAFKRWNQIGPKAFRQQ